MVIEYKIKMLNQISIQLNMLVMLLIFLIYSITSSLSPVSSSKA